MEQADRNLESAVELDKIFLTYLDEITFSAKVLISAVSNAEGILRDHHSRVTMQRIRDLIDQMQCYANDAEMIISAHKRKAELELDGYKKLTDNK